MRMWDGKKPLRLLNVTATRLTEFEYRQYSLFDSVDYEKLEKANQAIDQIRSKFGENAVMRASFLKSSVSPTSGGLNKDCLLYTSKAKTADTVQTATMCIAIWMRSRRR